jgi:hypothetical protein
MKQSAKTHHTTERVKTRTHRFKLRVSKSSCDGLSLLKMTTFMIFELSASSPSKASDSGERALAFAPDVNTEPEANDM